MAMMELKKTKLPNRAFVKNAHRHGRDEDGEVEPERADDEERQTETLSESGRCQDVAEALDDATLASRL